jgi:uncharacterized membrane protein
MKINPFVVFLTFVSLVGLFLLYEDIPQQIPMQWDLDGEVNYYGSKAFLWLLASLGMLIHLLLLLFQRIDPKKANYEKHIKVFNILNVVLPMFLTALFWFTVLWSLGIGLSVTLFVKLGLGLVITILGNYMGKVRQTFLFGVRTPWTLADEEVWDKTHRLAGWTMFFSGLLMMLMSFWEAPWSFWVGISSIVMGVIIPVVYSYLIFQAKKAKGQNAL